MAEAVMMQQEGGEREAAGDVTAPQQPVRGKSHDLRAQVTKKRCRAAHPRRGRILSHWTLGMAQAAFNPEQLQLHRVVIETMKTGVT
ncbi:hypothetical protein EOD39_16405 [Acipenser ruthenus]|uniref:Uncharacterized protein n=1 Tax=Acipenser ruthenus TaxID=7906 RepID=A0A444V622_ACIRT|nr:hypothetical protein EOD39_16405 [Acipenser ruthenus]